MSQSYFYTNVFTSFRDSKYDVAINNVLRYSLWQSPTGFRRIYNLLSNLLDRIEGMDLNGAKGEDLRRLQRELTRMRIIIEYQANRNVLHRDLANGIERAIDDIVRAIGGRNFDQAKQLAAALRDSLDAVLAFKITAKRGKEEEEEEFL